MNSTQLWILGGGLVLIVLGNLAPWLLGKIGSLSAGGKSVATKDAVPSRIEVLADLDGASRYFESIGCPEGVVAIQTAVNHAFAQHTKPGATT